MTAITHLNLVDFVESLISKDNIHLNLNPTITTGYGNRAKVMQIGGKTPALTVAHNIMKGLVTSAKITALGKVKEEVSEKASGIAQRMAEAERALNNNVSAEVPTIDDSSNFDSVDEVTKNHAIAIDLLSVALQIEPIVMSMGGLLGHTESFYKIQSPEIQSNEFYADEAEKSADFTSDEKARGQAFMDETIFNNAMASKAEAVERKEFLDAMLEDASADHEISYPDDIAVKIGQGLNIDNDYYWIPNLTSLVQDCEDKIIRSKRKFKQVNQVESKKSKDSVVSLWNGVNSDTGEVVSTVETLLDGLMKTAYDETPDIH